MITPVEWLIAADRESPLAESQAALDRITRDMQRGVTNPLASELS